MLGNSLKTLRKNKDISLGELSKRTGISKSYLSDLENNKSNNPSIRHLIRLANELDIDVVHLIEEIENTDVNQGCLEVIESTCEKEISKEEIMK
jgi:XRE family transcriptional regulator, master regulator for biofilm formation